MPIISIAGRRPLRPRPSDAGLQDRRLAEGGGEILRRHAGLRCRQEMRLAQSDRLSSPRKVVEEVTGEGDRAMCVGMHHVTWRDAHAGHMHRHVPLYNVPMSVAWGDAAGKQSEACGQQRKVTHRAVRHYAAATERDVDGGVHVTPDAAEADGVRDVFRDKQAGLRRCPQIAPVRNTPRCCLGRRPRSRPRSLNLGRDRDAGHRRLVRPCPDEVALRERHCSAIGPQQIEGVADGWRVEARDVTQQGECLMVGVHATPPGILAVAALTPDTILTPSRRHSQISHHGDGAAGPC